MPDAAVLATILLIVGLCLIAVELMVPSFGLITASAAVCLVISSWSAYQAWWNKEPVFFWTYVMFLLAGLPTSIFGTLYLIQHTALGGFVILRTPQQAEDGPDPEMQSHLSELVGKFGRSISPLTPGGMVEVNGERHHAECTGPLVDSGQSIEVVGACGTRLVVRKCADHSVTQNTETARTETNRTKSEQTAASDDGSKSTGQLDFDIPDNYTAG